MQKFVTYYRLLILLAMLVVLPGLSMAQSVSLSRERDSLINVISKEKDKARLAQLNLRLANVYNDLREIDKVNEPATNALFYAQGSDDFNTLLAANLLLGKNNLDRDNSVEAIQNYLSARKVLEKRAAYIREQTEQGKRSKEQQKLDKQQLNADKEQDASIVNQIGMVYYGRKHYSRASESFLKAVEEYEKLKCDKQALETRRYLAQSYEKDEDDNNALKQYEYLLKKYHDNDDWENIRWAYQKLNNIYSKQKNYTKLYDLNHDLYNECTKHGNGKEALNALNNVAYTCVNLGQYEKAVKYYQQILDADIKYNNEKMVARTKTNLGLCYQNMGDDDMAAKYLEEAIHDHKNQYKERANVGNILSLIYLKNQDLHNAENYCKDAVRDAEQTTDTLTLMSVYETYSKILQARGDAVQAFDYYQKYLKLKEARDFRKTLEDQRMADDLKMLTDAEKNFQDGLVAQDISELSERHYQMVAEAQERELANAQQQALIQEMEKERLEQANKLLRQQQEAMQRENEIKELQRQKELDELEMNNQRLREKELQDRNERNRLELENQQNQIDKQKAEKKQMQLIMALGLAVVLFFIVMFILVRKKNNKLKEQQAEIEQKNQNLMAANNEILTKNEELSKQKAIIEEANKSITDSIVYAKRIQNAVCPSPDFLSAFNFDYFLFFRPRDIVSGDYYWFFADDKNHVFIVAADCTGHGVPGAFMSMLGLSLFNKIVAERQIIEPGDILTTLRTEVKAALHQDSINSSQKDGMDLSLVRYDVDTNMLHFAGANNNGYIVKRFSFEEEEEAKKDLAKPDHVRDTPYGFLRLVPMPADSMPIGVYIREKERFTQSSYQLRRGDSFYLTSDGYIDQFGGQHGRKFLSKNFQQLIMDINQYDMKRQERIVIDTHEEWIGDSYDQLDDIIVIGIRV